MIDFNPAFYDFFFQSDDDIIDQFTVIEKFGMTSRRLTTDCVKPQYCPSTKFILWVQPAN